jgi:hypothetical protein
MIYISYYVHVLFRNCVASGTHEVPLFKGKPPAGIVEELSHRSAKNVIKSWKWEKAQKMVSNLYTLPVLPT